MPSQAGLGGVLTGLPALRRMRWSVVGYPRVPWEACGIFDGVSEFRLDNNGKIYEVRLPWAVRVGRAGLHAAAGTALCCGPSRCGRAWLNGYTPSALLGACV